MQNKSRDHRVAALFFIMYSAIDRLIPCSCEQTEYQQTIGVCVTVREKLF